jgi:hypothetical protein
MAARITINAIAAAAMIFLDEVLVRKASSELKYSVLPKALLPNDADRAAVELRSPAAFSRLSLGLSRLK